MLTVPINSPYLHMSKINSRWSKNKLILRKYVKVKVYIFYFSGEKDRFKNEKQDWLSYKKTENLEDVSCYL